MQMAEEFTKEYAEEPPLTVGDLRKILRKYPADMKLIQTRYSDYCFQKPSDWDVVEAINKGPDEWLMRVHETMSDEEKAKAKKYLHIHGN
jgi:hypothetical protein